MVAASGCPREQSYLDEEWVGGVSVMEWEGGVLC